MSFTSSELTELSDDTFDQLLGNVPEGTVNQDHLLGSTEAKSQDKKADKKEVKEVKEEETTKVTQLTSEELDNDIDSLIDDDDIVEVTTNSGQKVSTKKEVDTNTESDFFKAKYEGLVARGIWEELDDESLKDFDWSEDNYGQLVELQAQWAAENKYNEKLNASGDYGKAIIEHIENGGDPENIISLFREMKKVKEIDTSTTEGKIDLLHKYYVEELGWSENKFKRDSDSWIDQGVLDEEVELANSKIQDSIKIRVEEERKEVEFAKKQQEIAQQNFAANMQKTVTSRTDLSKKEQEEILNNLLKYDKKLPDGRIVNQFTLDFMKMQSDPNQYIDFVRFVNNPTKYNKTIETKVESDTNKKNWNLIKGGTALSRNTGTKEVERSSSKSFTGPKFDYKSILDNRK